MRVGSSPVYLIPGQEPMLENFSQHLKSKEKEAFSLLKEKKFIKDDKQDPAIRIALREIKDFAIPFKEDEEIFWRYFTVPKEEFKQKEKPSKEPEPIKEISQPKDKPELDIFEEAPSKTPEPKKQKPIKKKKAVRKKQDSKFFNKVKEFLSQKSIEILDIESFNKNDLILRIQKNSEEKLLIAFNKKRITEADIIKAHKKAQELNLKYIILSLGEPLKKTSSFIEAIKSLDSLERIE